jgi:hypothetical protein
MKRYQTDKSSNYKGLENIRVKLGFVKSRSLEAAKLEKIKLKEAKTSKL